MSRSECEESSHGIIHCRKGNIKGRRAVVQKVEEAEEVDCDGVRGRGLLVNGCFRSSKKSVPSSILPNFAERGDPAAHGLRLTCRDPPTKQTTRQERAQRR